MNAPSNNSMDVRAKQRLCYRSCPLKFGGIGGGFAPRHLNRSVSALWLTFKDEEDMSKLGCECGDVISDTTDNIPYKGAIIRDQDIERVFDDGIAIDVNDFIEAISQNKREEWIRGYFLPAYPFSDVSNLEVISDIISRRFVERKLDVYQCLSCGSVKIQDGLSSNTFSSFAAKEWQKGNESILKSEGEKTRS